MYLFPIQWRRAVTAILVFFLFNLALQQGLAQTPKRDAPASVADSAKDYGKEPWVAEEIATTIQYQADGTGRRELAVRVRVQSDEGVRQFGVLTLPYDAHTIKLESLEVQVRKADGTVVTTPESSVQDLSTEVSRQAPMYSDGREKQVPVKSLGVGDTLSYRVVWRQTKADVEGQFWYQHSFTSQGIVLKETLRVDVPSGKYVQMRSPKYVPEKTEREGRTIYRWSHKALTTPQDEQKPDAKKAKPEAADVRLTTFRSWEEVGAWYRSLAAKQAAVTPPIQAKAEELTRGLKSVDEKARAIYDYVSTKLRYVSISLGAGRYEPHAAEEVLANGYGDCKDKHTLLAALLKVVGVQVWPVLASAEQEVDTELPSPGQFDHLLTAMPKGQEIVWLDTTPEVAPWGALIAGLRDKKVLVIGDSGAARVSTTPATLPSRSVDEINLDGTLSEDDVLSARMSMKVWGDSAMVFRTLFRQAAPARWQETMQLVLRSMGYAGTVSGLDIENLDEIEAPLKVAWNYKRPQFGDWENQRLLVPTPPMPLRYSTSDTKPEEPIELGTPVDIVYRATLHMPKGYSLEAPADVALDKDFASYRAHYEVKDGVLVAERKLSTLKRKVQVEQWPQYVELAKGIVADYNVWAVFDRPGDASKGTGVVAPTSNAEAAEHLQKGVRAAAKHDMRTARAEFEMAEKLHADEPGLQTAIGMTLLGDGRTDEAVERMRRELKSNPTAHWGCEMLVTALRNAQRRGEAIKETQSCLATFTSDGWFVEALTNLMIEDKRPLEALREIDTALKARPDDVALKLLRVRVLVETERKAEGVEMAREMLATKSVDAAVLNNVAWSLVEHELAPELALQIAERAVADNEAALKESTLKNVAHIRALTIGETWDTLGWAHWRLGQIDQAERFVRAAWQLTQTGGVGEHLGEIYERQGKRSEAMHVYRLALAADSKLVVARQRLKELEKQEPAPVVVATSRMPVVTPGEELGRLRTVDLPELGERKATAELALLVSARGVEDVGVISGDDAFTAAVVPVLKKTRLSLSFPGSDAVRLVRRGIVSCSSYTKPSCSLVLMPLSAEPK